MKGLATKIEVLALRRLLIELKEHRPDICFRYRLIGHMWATHFLRVIQVTEQGAVLSDESSKQLVHIPDLSLVMQFELDKTFQSFQPYIHYDVVLAGDW